ncbi:MAG TPA: serine hydrolase domain-containing protein [Gemmatimonadaceae bacterium]|nr:serine hydrolase domain-containing protein [Gemmatimonadaceae bacterium]
MRTATSILATASLLLAAPLALAPACAQQPAPRAASSEQTLRDLVRVMNGGNPDSLRAFVRDRFVIQGEGVPTAEERAERLGRIHGFLGEVAVRSVGSAGAARATALVQSTRTESWRRITIFLDSAATGRIARVGLAPASDPAAPTRRLSDAEIVEQLRAYVERMAKRDVFSGAVLLARDGKPLYRAAFGEANKDFGVRNAADTKFNLGSMNKMFTAVSIMQLAEAGKLSLKDTLGKFLPAGSMRPEVLQKVRIEHLLTHTSGLGSYFTPEWDGLSRARFRTVDDWMPLVKDERLQFEPGTRWSYSNTGMLVLGKVIEAASGEDYFDYVRRHVYAPAGMVNSDAYELDRVNRNLAVGYEREETPKGVEWRNNIFAHVIRGGPAGGGYSTVDDLTRFAVALQSGKLVGRESVKLLTTPKPELSSPDYGYGFQIEENGRVVGHSGGFLGINSELDIYLGDGYTLAVMSNYGGGAQPIVEKTRALLLAGRPQTASR